MDHSKYCNVKNITADTAKVVTKNIPSVTFWGLCGPKLKSFYLQPEDTAQRKNLLYSCSAPLSLLMHTVQSAQGSIKSVMLVMSHILQPDFVEAEKWDERTGDDEFDFFSFALKQNILHRKPEPLNMSVQHRDLRKNTKGKCNLRFEAVPSENGSKIKCLLFGVKPYRQMRAAAPLIHSKSFITGDPDDASGCDFHLLVFLINHTSSSRVHFPPGFLINHLHWETFITSIWPMRKVENICHAAESESATILFY